LTHGATIRKVAGSIRDAVDSACNRNEYQEHFLVGKGDRYVGLTTLPPSCVYFREIWSLNLQGLSGPVHGMFYRCVHNIRVHARTYIRCILTHNAYISEDTAILRL
jgi:hypothetical protein